MSKFYSTGFDSKQASCFSDEVRDLPYLAGFDPESAEMLAVVGVENGGSLGDMALGTVLANALIGLREGRWTSYSRHAGFYTGLDRYHATLKHNLIIRAVEQAERLGWIEHEKAESWPRSKGWQSRFRASDRLTAVLAEHRLMQRHEMIQPMLREVLQLRDPETGKLLPYRETGRTRAMRQDLLSYNAHLARHRIDIQDERVVRLGSGLMEVPTKDGLSTFLVRERFSYVRMFTGDWSWHGRFYGPHWQSLPTLLRPSITIDGASTGRFDYGNSHVRIAYAEAGVDPGPEDAYRVRGYDEDDAGRRLMKVATNIAINTTGKDKAIETVAFSIAEADHERETGSAEGAKIGAFDMGAAAKAIDAVERRHPALDRVFYTGAGLRFMAVEADVMMNVIKAARRVDIPVLSIHDEAMFPKSRADMIEAMMHDAWRKEIPIPAIVRP